MAERAAKNPTRHEFRAVIEGVELPPDMVARLNKAVQTAVLAELAGLDLRGDLAVQLRIPENVAAAALGGGRTDGIFLREVASQ